MNLPRMTFHRVAVSKRLRFEVFKRDGFVCQYCGSHPPDAILECDHIIPVCEGGSSDIENLIASCFACNRGKADVSLSVIPKSLSDRAEEVKEREEQLAGYREVMQARADRIEEDMWRIADALITNASVDGMRRDHLQSIKRFNERLPIHEVLDAVEIARAKFPYRNKQNLFSYFCGVCWNKVRESTNG